MRCKKEEFIQGNIFHVYNRSVDEVELFKNRNDYLYFLEKLNKNYDPMEFGIYAYCLMPNHLHFCIKQKNDRPVYDLFNRFIISYTLHFNSKYNRKGKVFSGKLQHKRIPDEKYLVDVCAYIHRNPLRAGLVNNAIDWEYSNFREWVGSRKGRIFDDYVLLEFFEDSKQYLEFVQQYDNDKIKEKMY